MMYTSQVAYSGGLESTVGLYSLCVTSKVQYRASARDHTFYSPSEYGMIDLHRDTHQHSPDPFLVPQRPYTPFVGEVQNIRQYIEECFEKVSGSTLPTNIIFRICNPNELKQVHSHFGKWSDGIAGFSLNRPNGISEVFVKKDSLDRVMVTIGHEIGHVITPSLQNTHDEESKAFAFEIAWLQALRQYNIAGLSDCIVDLTPANNGLHDRAFAFVRDKVLAGMKALDVFWHLAQTNPKGSS